MSSKPKLTAAQVATYLEHSADEYRISAEQEAKTATQTDLTRAAVLLYQAKRDAFAQAAKLVRDNLV